MIKKDFDQMIYVGLIENYPSSNLTLQNPKDANNRQTIKRKICVNHTFAMPFMVFGTKLKLTLRFLSTLTINFSLFRSITYADILLRASLIQHMTFLLPSPFNSLKLRVTPTDRLREHESFQALSVHLR